MRVGRGDFDQEMAVADVGKVSAVQIDQIFTHHRADGDIAKWAEMGDDLVFLARGSRHIKIIVY